MTHYASFCNEGVSMTSDKQDGFVIFATVGDVESISGAARALGLPKATVSRAVSNLESVFKVKLIERTARKSQLTEAGKIMYARCCRIREEIADVGSEIAAYRGEPMGTLRVGCPSDLARIILTPYLHNFLERYPDIDLRINVGERLMPEATSLDVVLHSGWLSDSRLVARKMTEIQTILVASKQYASSKGMPVSPEELSEHAVIGNYYLDVDSTNPGRLPAYVPKLELIRGDKKYVLPTWKRFASTDHHQILELVKNGQVIAPLPIASMIGGILSGDFVHILPDYRISSCPALYALYTDRVSMVPKLQVFLGFVEDVIADQKKRAGRVIEHYLKQRT